METNCVERAVKSNSLTSVRDEIRELLIVRQDWDFHQTFFYNLLAERESQLLFSHAS
jgi:hypothetical protein